MANCIKTGLLSLKWKPTLECVRYRRVNVQRPRAPHYERAKFLALINPIFPQPETVNLPPSLTCKRKEELAEKTFRPDNPYERILAKEVLNWFNHSKMIAFYHANPISGNDKFQATIKFKRENMYLKVYSQHTVRMALEDTHYAGVLQLFKAHNAIVFSEEHNVTRLLNISKKIPQLVLMAAVVEGKLLSVSQLKLYSELKNITTARSQLVATLNSATSRLVAQLAAQQSTLIGQLNQIVDMKNKAENPPLLSSETQKKDPE